MENLNLADNLQDSQATLIIVLALNILVILILLYFIVRQNRHIEQLEAAVKPKYGFLGKPLFSFMAVVLMIGGFIAIYSVSENLSDVQVSGNEQVELNITVKPGRETAQGREVSFQVVPVVEGLEWGGELSGMSFDVYWSIIGNETFSEFEVGLSYTKQGGFKRVVPPGTYQVRTDVIYLGQTYTSTVKVGL